MMKFGLCIISSVKVKLVPYSCRGLGLPAPILDTKPSASQIRVQADGQGGVYLSVSQLSFAAFERCYPFIRPQEGQNCQLSTVANVELAVC